MSIREQMIRRKAALIAGCAWDDIYSKQGTLADRLRAAADHRNEGTDGDLSDLDRAMLRKLAEEAGEAFSPEQPASTPKTPEHPQE